MHPQFYRFTRRNLLFCLILALLVSSPLDVGAIEVTKAGTGIVDGTIHLNADVKFELPESVRTALDKGVDLFFSTNLKIVKRRKWMLDKAEVNIEVVRRLSFHALTQKYVVDDLALKRRRSFSSLSAALSYMGRYRKVPLVSDVVISRSPDMYVRMRIKLESRELPLPLRLRRVLSRAWRLSSDWYEWRLSDSHRP